jgi:hypothetical protein
MSKQGVQIGSRWEDKDPRKFGRVVEVEDIDSRYAYCVVVIGTSPRRSRILLSHLPRRFRSADDE